MVKGLMRYALIWGISTLLTPYVNRFFDRLATQAPKDSFLEDALLELSGRYSTSLPYRQSPTSPLRSSDLQWARTRARSGPKGD